MRASVVVRKRIARKVNKEVPEPGSSCQTHVRAQSNHKLEKDSSGLSQGQILEGAHVDVRRRDDPGRIAVPVSCAGAILKSEPRGSGGSFRCSRFELSHVDLSLFGLTTRLPGGQLPR